ncbi:MAG: DUF262 domain-containing HNH endonuclease family protein [Clostridium sp.]|uniref:DUF262 domain-containing protein n=1 Tax=Clostridium sp. TaxID=1506 RepID=UPI0029002478|nr:DUF262 domain-containing HNH endonuclease family protein [Clostridium sp.]MDU1228907.1 DUF262 domain-containing HNH endonuclease family protein [Clostridium sp.]MDU3088454.1 DUF262 domain-containing HNH endonuclease family protein [Clostridium sp.]
MENGQKTIKDLFDGKKIFKIPEYQRAYAWEEKQLHDFIEDIKNQREDKNYFFGTILFQEVGSKSNFEVIEIVDGQQRITTLIIFLNELIKTIHNETKEIYVDTFIKSFGTYKLEVLRQDNEFFKSYIIEDNILNEGLITTPSQKKLVYAKKYFREQVELFNDCVESIITKISNTNVLTYSVKDKSEATLIFETTNDRGKQLSNIEKTKSFLMYKTYLCSEKPEEELTNIQSRFTSIYNDYSLIEDEIEENSILQYHFIAFEQWTSGKIKEYQKYMEKLKYNINQFINEEKDDLKALTYINKYSRELRETFCIVREIIYLDIPELEDLKILSNMANFYPLIIKTYKLDSDINKNNFKRVLRLIEIYIFRVYCIHNSMSYTGQSKFFSIARDFQGNFEDLISHIKDIIGEYSVDKKFIEDLKYEDFCSYYSSNVKNYFFWKYENYLRTNEQPVASEIGSKEFKSKNKRTKFSIEHIIPQNPDEEYKKVIENDLMYDKVDENFQEKYLNCIGNLTIDPMSANASKQNYQYEIKENKYFKRAPFKCQNELIDFLENEKFTANSIISRENKLIEFALKYWNYRNI